MDSKLLDVVCVRCLNQFEREFEHSKFQGRECDGSAYIQDLKGGYESEFGQPPSLKSVASGKVYMQCGYGSKFDTCSFRFGRRYPLSLEECPNWVQEWIGKPHVVCDQCIKEMLKLEEIKFVSCMDNFGSIPHPAYCDSCNQLFEKTGCDYVVRDRYNGEMEGNKYVFKNKNEFVIEDTKTPLFQADYDGKSVLSMSNLEYKFKDNLPKWVQRNYAICKSCFDLELENGNLILEPYDANYFTTDRDKIWAEDKRPTYVDWGSVTHWESVTEWGEESEKNA
jgi:hypothetical protein